MVNEMEDRLVITGHDPGDAFWIRPVIVPAMEKITVGDVMELDGEISIDAKGEK